MIMTFTTSELLACLGTQQHFICIALCVLLRCGADPRWDLDCCRHITSSLIGQTWPSLQHTEHQESHTKGPNALHGCIRRAELLTWLAAVST